MNEPKLTVTGRNLPVSDDFRKLNPGFYGDRNKNRSENTGTITKLESSPGFGSLGTGKTQIQNTARVLVRVTSVRKQLLDEDNLCEKFHVDCCRYAGFIFADDPSKATIKVSQRKVQKGEEEHTLIEIEPI